MLRCGVFVTFTWRVCTNARRQDRRSQSQRLARQHGLDRRAPTASADACQSKIRAPWSTPPLRVLSITRQPSPIPSLVYPWVSCPDVPAEALDPRRTWADPRAYDAQARHLAELFATNIQKLGSSASSDVTAAGPSWHRLRVELRTASGSPSELLMFFGGTAPLDRGALSRLG